MKIIWIAVLIIGLGVMFTDFGERSWFERLKNREIITITIRSPTYETAEETKARLEKERPEREKAIRELSKRDPQQAEILKLTQEITDKYAQIKDAGSYLAIKFKHAMIVAFFLAWVGVWTLIPKKRR